MFIDGLAEGQEHVLEGICSKEYPVNHRYMRRHRFRVTRYCIVPVNDLFMQYQSVK